MAVLHDAHLEESPPGGLARLIPKLGALLERWPPAALALPEGRTLAERGISFFAALASSCLVHGPHYVDDVVAACPGPTVQLPLCFPDIGAVPPVPDGSGAFVVVCFGLINLNKQPERILRALAADPALRARGRMRFVGPIEEDYRTRLTALSWPSWGWRGPTLPVGSMMRGYVRCSPRRILCAACAIPSWKAARPR